jgi:hypothetical protein
LPAFPQGRLRSLQASSEPLKLQRRYTMLSAAIYANQTICHAATSAIAAVVHGHGIAPIMVAIGTCVLSVIAPAILVVRPATLVLNVRRLYLWGRSVSRNHAVQTGGAAGFFACRLSWDGA